jgi:ATP-dependent RNA helicase SrmB
MMVVGKIERYQDQRLQRRVINELRPKHKESRVANKKAKVKLSTAQKKAKVKKQSKKKIKS